MIGRVVLLVNPLNDDAGLRLGLCEAPVKGTQAGYLSEACSCSYT